VPVPVLLGTQAPLQQAISEKKPQELPGGGSEPSESHLKPPIISQHTPPFAVHEFSPVDVPVAVPVPVPVEVPVPVPVPVPEHSDGAQE